ncbi:PREDICTED: chymotrypsin-2-like [Ceratosolen solmsi marchali]|uniref:Chymotrypsin-2-like n=1 Tax=Ceratosolen solmsi marchali TaxID=326594 RepID=A0AAJ6YX62_9HYME|nr:PREDICTED: chymotrypsin-2-like [Ceratosolen solmsi marchali]
MVSGLLGINVRNVEPNEFSSTVSIVTFNQIEPQEQRHTYCTGSLISQRHVLSAEHCFDEIGNTKFEILAESYNLTCAKRFYPSWWTTFDQWKFSTKKPNYFRDNDISIIKIVGSVSPDTQPALISLISPQSLLYGLQALMVGFGSTHENANPTILHKGAVNIISKEECQGKIARLAGDIMTVHLRYLCSFSEPYTQIANGDSGGPLFYEGVIVGINKGLVPKFRNLFHRHKVNVHTGVDYYREFIDFQMGILY